MSVQFKLDSFEGPLDLLLHLIDREEIDIYDIPISHITSQYLLFIDEAREFELNIASEFIVMAATLMEIKSKLLLPKPPVDIFDSLEDWEYEEEDPREALVRRLIEYRKFKVLADELRNRETDRNKIFSRPPENLAPYMPEEEENPVAGVTLYDLLSAFKRALKKREPEPFSKIDRDEVSVSERIVQVMDILRNRGGRIRFTSLFNQSSTKSELVTTFLVVLELIKSKKIICTQSNLFDDIMIEINENEGENEAGLLVVQSSN